MNRELAVEQLEMRRLFAVQQLTAFDAPYRSEISVRQLGTTDTAVLIRVSKSGVPATTAMTAVGTDGTINVVDVGSDVITSLRGPNHTAVLLCGNGVWQTDGTQAGTRRLFNGVPLSNPNGGIKLAVDVENARAYFFAQAGSGSGYSLWRADLNTGSAQNVGNVGGSAGWVRDFPMSPIVVDGRLFFSMTTGGAFRQLWTYSPSEGVRTIPLRGTGEPYGMGESLAQMGDTIVFGAYAPSVGWEPFAYTVGEPDVRLLADLAPGEEGSMTNNQSVIDATARAATFGAHVGGVLRYYVTDGDHVSVLRAPDGSAANSPPSLSEAAGGRVVWRNAEIDVSSGQSTPFLPGATSLRVIAPLSDTQTLVSAAGLDNGTSPAQLYVTDGTPQGTTLLMGAHAGSDLQLLGVSPSGTVFLQRTLALNATNGSEIIATDGTVAHTRVLDARGMFVGTFADGSAITVKATLEAGYQLYRLSLDTVAPVFEGGTFEVNGIGGPSVALLFSERLAALSEASFVIRDRVTGSLVSAADVSVASGVQPDGTTKVRVTIANGSLANGDYQLVLSSAAGIDLEGNTLAEDAIVPFSILAGDADQNRVVDFGDLLILASHFNQSGHAFSEGNVDYSADGLVGFDDLLILAKNYGVELAMSPGSVAGFAEPQPVSALRTRKRFGATIVS